MKGIYLPSFFILEVFSFLDIDSAIRKVNIEYLGSISYPILNRVKVTFTVLEKSALLILFRFASSFLTFSLNLFQFFVNLPYIFF